jgi:zinc transport system ATP-binding protein
MTRVIGPYIEARDVVVGYRGRALLPPVNLVVQPAETWVVVGRNGAGKSTLLKTLLGLLPPVLGQVVRRPGMRVAYVPQRLQLEATVPMRGRDVVAMGWDAGWSFAWPWRPGRVKDVVQAALRRVDAESFADERFGALSTGQQQRIVLAQALVGAPDLIVLDEPTAAMDMVAERETLRLLDDLRRERGTAIVWVTHRLGEGLRDADHVCFVDAEERAVVVDAPGNIVRHPLFLQHFGQRVGPDVDFNTIGAARG